MDTLASASDLIVGGYDPAQIAAALSWATSAIEGYCNRSFALVTGDVVTLTPRARGGILPNYPVVQVTLVEGYLPSLNGLGMEWKPMTNYWLVAETGELFDTAGLPGTLFHGPRSWPWLPGSLRVTYDHGFATVPRNLRDVCARIAVQYLENPALMVERRVGDMEARFAGTSGASAGLLFGQMDLAVLDGYTDVGVVKPGNETIQFSVRGPTVGRNADGIAQYDPTVTPVEGCFLQDFTLSDKITETEFAQSTHRCISPADPAVIACSAEDTLTDSVGVKYRVEGKRTYRDWHAVVDHITVYCIAQSG